MLKPDVNSCTEIDTTSRMLSRRSMFGALAALAAAPLLPRRAAAADAVKLGYLPVNAMTTIYTGAADAWAGFNTKFELLRLQGGPAIVQAIQAGSIQGGELAVTVLLSLASRKIPIVCLANSNNATRRAPYNRIMVPEGSPLRSIADLRGKSVGMLALGTLDHVQLLAALKAAGVDAHDVNILSIPVPNQPQALASKQVDAMVMPPPADAVAEIRYGARALADATDALPYYPLEMLIADARWIERNPKSSQELVAGWIKTSRWIEGNRAQARLVMKEVLKLPADIADRARLPQWNLNCLPVMPGVWNLYYAMVTNRLIEASPDPEGMMHKYVIEPTMKFVLPALDEVGRVKDMRTAELRKMKLPYLPKDPERYLGPWES